MRIAIFGAGAIGSIFAYQLGRAGHDVTVIARGARLASLRQTNTIDVRHLISGKEDSVPVHVSDTLERDVPWDLLLVTVQRHQVDAVAEIVAQSRANRIMFMFNTAADITDLATRVGRERFLWGFPAALGAIEGGRVDYEVVPSWLRFLQVTTIGGLPGDVPTDLEVFQTAFRSAGIPTAISRDMPAWLKSHAAFMVPLMVAGLNVDAPAGKLPWAAAVASSRGMLEAFRIVRETGTRLEPMQMAAASHLPRLLVSAAVWGAFRIGFVRKVMLAHVGHAQEEVDVLLRDLRVLADPGASPNLAALQASLSQHNSTH